MVQHPHNRTDHDRHQHGENATAQGHFTESDGSLGGCRPAACRPSHPMELEAYEFVFASPMVSVGSRTADYARISFPPRDRFWKVPLT